MHARQMSNVFLSFLFVSLPLSLSPSLSLAGDFSHIDDDLQFTVKNDGTFAFASTGTSPTHKQPIAPSTPYTFPAHSLYLSCSRTIPLSRYRISYATQPTSEMHCISPALCLTPPTPSSHPTTHENESEPTGRLRARTVSRHYSSARISVTQHPFVGVVDGHHRAPWAIVSLHATTPPPPPPASSLSCAACALLYQPPVHHKNRWRHHASPSSHPPHPGGDCPLHEKRRAGCREGVAAVQRVFIATSYRGERAPPCAARTFERYASQQ